jgi:hypothetical protein
MVVFRIPVSSTARSHASRALALLHCSLTRPPTVVRIGSVRGTARHARRLIIYRATTVRRRGTDTALRGMTVSWGVSSTSCTPGGVPSR